MSASREWTEWHLTPSGWKSGTNKCDGSGITAMPTPSDRTLTIRVTMSVGFGSPHIDKDTVWQSDDKNEIQRLKSIHGECPERI